MVRRRGRLWRRLPDLQSRQPAGRQCPQPLRASGHTGRDSRPEVLLSRRKAVEQTYAGYGVVDFAVLNDRIRGNAGVRVVRTELDAQAMIADTSGGSAVIVPNNKSNSYTDVLPTLNVTGYITDDLLLRFGYGKSLTRPSVGDINPTVSVNVTNGTGSQGNANLAPLRATSYDLSLEKYFSKSAYASAAMFYKKVDGFTLGVEACQTVATAPAYAGTTPNNCATGQYRVTQSVNADPGYAKGVELAAQTFFDYDFVPDFLHNFGVQGSYTWVKTELPVLLAGAEGQCPTAVPIGSPTGAWRVSTRTSACRRASSIPTGPISYCSAWRPTRSTAAM
ncbi:TonB-dependent receptor domain-containing protein [Caulobacter segnis]